MRFIIVCPVDYSGTDFTPGAASKYLKLENLLFPSMLEVQLTDSKI
jgi:hypothetical protein